jgi:hypothetical protein
MFIVLFYSVNNFLTQIIDTVLFFRSIDFHMVLIVHFLSVYLYLSRVNRP